MSKCFVGRCSRSTHREDYDIRAEEITAQLTMSIILIAIASRTSGCFGGIVSPRGARQRNDIILPCATRTSRKAALGPPRSCGRLL